MAQSVARLTVGALMLAGATAGAVGAPQPSEAAEQLSASLANPVYVVTLAAAIGLLALVLVRVKVSGPTHSGKHRR